MLLFDPFTASYIRTALWTGSDAAGDVLLDGYTAADIDEESLNTMIEDCKTFQEANQEWLTSEHCLKASNALIIAGHDFWLTRNGHGAGFWDGDWDEEAGKILTQASKAYGTADLYLGDDNRIYISRTI